MSTLEEMNITVDTEAPVTLQNFLTGRKGVSRRLLTKLKRLEGGITRRGEVVRSIDTVYPGDVIVLRFEDSSFLEPNGKLSVGTAYEDENIIIFDKPGGMPVHPSIKHQGDTLGNYFAYRFPGLTFRPVNRLDRDTSGLCLAAKNAHAANLMQYGCRKVYYAAVHGITDEKGTISAPIARQQESIILRCVREDGQPAVTHYERIGCGTKYSLLRIDLETGRTHQIRVHFSHIGHPLAGDDMYGGLRDDIGRQALHCGEMIFTEPFSGREITVRSELPEEISKLILL